MSNKWCRHGLWWGMLFLFLQLHHACQLGAQQTCTNDPECVPPFSVCVSRRCVACRVDGDCAPTHTCTQNQCLLPSQNDGSTLLDTPLLDALPMDPHPDLQTPAPEREPLAESKTPPEEPNKDASSTRERPPETPMDLIERHPVEPAPPDTSPLPESTCQPGQKKPCYPAATETKGVGLCQPGQRLCNTNRVWGSCLGAITPQPELCDNKDNDCDGKIDEDFPLKGQPCAVGRGTCRKTGTYVCNSPVYSLRCNALPGVPASEKCDGKDNDCDGTIDENCTCSPGSAPRPCGSDVGACRLGVQRCTLIGFRIYRWQCGGGTKPNTESCDGKDNDCDGTIDENCCLPHRFSLRWQAHATTPTSTKGITGLELHQNDGFLASSGEDRLAKLWDITTTPPKLLQTLTHTAPVSSLSLDAKEKVVATATSDRKIHAWTTAGLLLRTLSPTTQSPLTAISLYRARSDGKRGTLAAGFQDGTVTLWNLEKQLPTKTFTHTGAITRIAYQRNASRLATASMDKTIRIWNENGDLRKTLSGHKAGVIGISWTSDGNHLYSVGLDGLLLYWNINQETPLKTLYTAPSSLLPQNVSASPDGLWIAAVFSDNKVRVWDTLHSKLRVLLSLKDNAGNTLKTNGTLTWSSNSKTLIAGDQKGQLHLFKCP